MTTTPSQVLKAETPAIPPNASNSLTAEYEAAITAHKQQLSLMGPTRKKYDELFFRHKSIQAYHDELMTKIVSQRSTYQRHKQYVMLLSNALLASNVTLSSAPKPFSDLQALTHATLFNKLRLASDTLFNLMVRNKRLEKKKDRSFLLDQEFYARCQELFKTVNKDCHELDRLHAMVLEAGKKIGKNTECGREDGKCISCIRNENAEAKRAAADKVIKGGSGKVRIRIEKPAEGKQKLEDIVEEEELEDEADA